MPPTDKKAEGLSVLSNNTRRRRLYHTNPAYAETAKRSARETYRKDNPLPPSRLANGLLERGETKELFTDEMEHPMYAEAFTLPQAARALGRSELCLKRWVSEGLIPPPILRDTVRRYSHYSAGELAVIARVLRAHEQEFRYLASSHTHTIHTMWQSMQAYRAMRV